MAMWINVREMKSQLSTSKNKMDASGRYFNDKIIPALSAVIDDRCLQGKGYDAMRRRFDASDRLVARGFKSYCELTKSTLQNNISKIDLYFPDGGYYNSDDITRQRNALSRKLTQRNEDFWASLGDRIADGVNKLDFAGIIPDSESSNLRAAIEKLDKRMRRLINYNDATRTQFNDVELRQNNLRKAVLDIGSARYNPVTGCFESTRSDVGNWRADVMADISSAKERIDAINADTQANERQIEINKQIEADENKSWFQKACDWVANGVSAVVEQAGGWFDTLLSVGGATGLFLLDCVKEGVGTGIGFLLDGVDIATALVTEGLGSWALTSSVWGAISDLMKATGVPLAGLAGVISESARFCIDAYLENPDAYSDFGEVLSALTFGVTHPDQFIDAIIDSNGLGKAVEAVF
jgi:hypothetical protein